MKFMNMKRFGSTLMAGALALSLATPAFASNNTVITGTYTPITLRVTVPSTGAAIINPYGLPYTLGESTISGQQIVTTAPLVLQNRSSVALAVSANVTATASANVTLEASSASTDYTTETGKKLQVVFEAFKADTLNGLNATDNDTLRPLFAALDSADAVLTADVVTTAGGDDTTGTLVLRESADGEVQEGGAAFFRLTGQAAKKATWAADDTFTATVAFTFEPGEYTKDAGGTFNIQRAISMTGTDNDSPVSYTPALPDGVTATSTVFSSSDTSTMKITVNGATTKIVAVAAGTADLIVTIEGSDGFTYTDRQSVTVGS